MSFEVPSHPISEPTVDAVKFEVVRGDGPYVWTRTPEEFGITPPITARLFSTSNVLRNIKPAPYKVNVSKGRLAQYEERPRTPYAAVVKDIYRHTLPTAHRELADILGNEAAEEEYDYEQAGLELVPDYQAELREVAAAHAGSLLMQGFKAYHEAADDYDGLIHDIYLTRAKMFGAHLIRTLY